jgi:hypothetical protein
MDVIVTVRSNGDGLFKAVANEVLPFWEGDWFPERRIDLAIKQGRAKADEYPNCKRWGRIK